MNIPEMFGLCNFWVDSFNAAIWQKIALVKKLAKALHKSNSSSEGIGWQKSPRLPQPLDLQNVLQVGA